jgi:hypothetical protein
MLDIFDGLLNQPCFDLKKDFRYPLTLILFPKGRGNYYYLPIPCGRGYRLAYPSSQEDSINEPPRPFGACPLPLLDPRLFSGQGEGWGEGQ